MTAGSSAQPHAAVDDVPGSPVDDGGADEQPVKTAELAKTAIAALYAEYRPSPEEIEEALQLVHERRLAKIAEQEALEKATSTNGFAHYFLANPVFPMERILIPESNGQFYAFYRGRILIDSPQKEELIRRACAGRIYEEDLTEPRKCKICQTLWFSSTALAQCQLGH